MANHYSRSLFKGETERKSLARLANTLCFLISVLAAAATAKKSGLGEWCKGVGTGLAVFDRAEFDSFLVATRKRETKMKSS